jgi:hypothetical protein
MNSSQELEELTPPAPQTVDLSQHIPITHSFDHIVGNQLLCSLHETCGAIFIKPTEVLEHNQQGDFVLVDRAPVS